MYLISNLNPLLETGLKIQSPHKMFKYWKGIPK
jgi:hypothetical protein